MNGNITRVALICKNESQAGGASTYEGNLIRYLFEQKDSQTEFVVFEPRVPKRGMQPRKVVGYDLGFIPQFSSLIRSTLPKCIAKSLFGVLKGNLARKLDENCIDIAYFLSPNPVALGLFSIPVITTVWDLGHRDERDYKELTSFRSYQKREYYYKKVSSRSCLVVTDSERTSTRLFELYNINLGKTLSAGLFPRIDGFSNVRLEKFATIPNPYIIYPAQFWRHKNHEFLLELMCDLKVDFPDLKLVLTGSDKGNLGNVRRRLRTLGLDSDVEVLGFVERTYLWSLISYADLMVFPSHLGPTNLPPLESLILGTPIVVTDKNSDLTHSPADGVWVVSEDSKEEYIRAITEILSVEPEFKPWNYENFNKSKTKAIIQRLNFERKV